MRTTTPRRTRGLTLIELVIASVLSLFLLLVLGEVVGTAATTHQQIAIHDRATGLGHEIFTELGSRAFSSRRVYADDDEGRAYLAALETGTLPLLANSRLPVVDPDGRLEPDMPGVPRTGNALLFAVEEAPLDVDANGNLYRLDRLRFVALYLSQQPERVVRSRDDRVDVVLFTSETYADRASLDAIADPDDRNAAVLALRAEGIDRAWVAGVDIDQAFFGLLPSGDIAAEPMVAPTIPSAADWPLEPMLHGRRMSVAANDPDLSVPLFAQEIAGQEEFPSGLEVKVVGPSSGRQVLVRLMTLSGPVNGMDVPTDMTKVFTVRDL